MSSEPWIGDEMADHPGRCIYSLDEFDPNSSVCGAPATVHVCSESAMYGEVSLSTCDRHAPIARAAGRLVGEHPFGDGCRAHSTWFRLDGCVPAESSGGVQ